MPKVPTKYSKLMSIFKQDEPELPVKPMATVEKRSRVSALFYSTAEVRSRSGETYSVREAIGMNPITVLFFGSPRYKKSLAMVTKLKKLQERGRELDRCIGVIYIPLYTYQESALEVEKEFQGNHGDEDWWILGFQSWEGLEAVFMHGVHLVPTLVVLTSEGHIVTECGQHDLAHYNLQVLTTWF